MTTYNRDGKVGPWAADKLKCLGDYLSAYTTILRQQEWCKGYFYFDAFAGAGRAQLRKDHDADSPDLWLLDVGAFGREDAEEITYIDGSPYVALEIEHPFTRYTFVEKDPERARRLADIQSQFGGSRNIDVVEGDANVAIQRFIGSADWKKHRAVMFLDPFGMQVPWHVLEHVAQTGTIEIILNLPVGMAIQRLLPRSGKFTAGQRDKLNDYFGSAEWEGVIYEKRQDLFGDMDTSKVSDAGKRMASWYKGRLEKAFGFAASPRLIRNSRGAHLYYLLFAGPNKTGAKIASHILAQGKSVGARAIAKRGS